jgi:hypothetical protein
MYLKEIRHNPGLGMLFEIMRAMEGTFGSPSLSVLFNGSANCCIAPYHGCLNRCRARSKTDYQRNL